MASAQPSQPAGTYTNLQPAAEEDGTVETRNPLAPPTTPTSPQEPLQPPTEPEEEPDGSKFRAVVAVVRCMVGPAALYIPKGFSDAGIGGSLVCIVVANVLFALGISRLVDCWRHARDEGLDTAHGIQGLARRLSLIHI